MYVPVHEDVSVITKTFLAKETRVQEMRKWLSITAIVESKIMEFSRSGRWNRVVMMMMVIKTLRRVVLIHLETVVVVTRRSRDSSFQRSQSIVFFFYEIRLSRWNLHVSSGFFLSFVFFLFLWEERERGLMWRRFERKMEFGFYRNTRTGLILVKKEKVKKKQQVWGTKLKWERESIGFLFLQYRFFFFFYFIDFLKYF